MKVSEEYNMKKNTSIINKNGFSLLEITVVLIIMSIILSAVIPVLSREYLEKASNRVVLDISAIQEASRKYYIDNSSQWPVANATYSTPVAALQGNNYLPSGWNAINPFGSSAATPSNYTYNVTSNSSALTVCTLVSADAQGIVQNSLTSPYIDVNGNVCSSVPVPGGAGSASYGPPIAMNANQPYCPGISGSVHYSGIPNGSTGRADIEGVIGPSSSQLNIIMQWYGTWQNINGAVNYGQAFDVPLGYCWEVEANNGSVMDLYWTPLN